MDHAQQEQSWPADGAATAGATAPELRVSRWFNTPAPLTLAGLRGKVVVLHAFQMLCPGCVAHGTPQTQRIAADFDPGEVAVIGLHTVFEHHDVMTARALEVFIHENRFSFPIGVDEPDTESGIPKTMRAYRMQGTPSLILIDRRGAVRLHEFGALSDLSVGTAIGRLLAQ
jgi:peroxiredoxin